LSKYEKLVKAILSGGSDRNIRFDDLRNLLLHLGFTERVGGSHHIFRHEGIRELINLQRDDGMAKGYQVRAIREIILKYNLK